MSGYLTTMNVAADAIAAHEKGEREHDTFHTIELTRRHVRIVKRSRVNNDVMVELTLGGETVEYLPPNNRPKRMMAISESLQHLRIESSLTTSNGTAIVQDVKRLSEDGTHMIQTIHVRNEETGQTNETTRIFVPYNETPPHLVPKPLDPEE